MAQPEEAILIIEKWRRQAFDLSLKSDDSLVSLSQKVFDVTSSILKSSHHSIIQHALQNLESDQSICLRSDKINERSIRSLMYGIIESLHLTVLHLMDQGMVNSESSISTVTEWKRKTLDFSMLSDEPMMYLFMKVFDVMLAVLKSSEHFNIQRALDSLDCEWQICVGYEKTDEPSIRSLMFGIIKSVHLILFHLIQKKSQTRPSEDLPKENEVPTETVDPIFTPYENLNLLPIHSSDHLPNIPNLIEPKEEEIDNYVYIPPKDEKSALSCMEGDIKKEDILNEKVIPTLIEPKEEEIDNYVHIPPKDEKSALSFMEGDIKKEDILDEDLPKEEPLDFSLTDAVDATLDFMGDDLSIKEEDILNDDMDSSETAELENRRRSSSHFSNSVKYTETEQSDGEIEPPVKKSKNNTEKKRDEQKDESKPESVKKRRFRVNDTELECPECAFRTLFAAAWYKHLRVQHSTTPFLAGYILRCDCGHESYSDTHIRKCEISNFTVVREGEKVTPQCVLCEAYPKNPGGYLKHIQIHHNSTLKTNGIYLLCSCGVRINSDRSYRENHDNKCD